MKTVFHNGSLVGKITGGIILAFLLLSIINLMGGAIASAFYEDTGTKLEKLKTDACHTIRIRENKCHNGDQQQCEKLKESAKWFSNTFRSNLTDCFSINSEFLTFGLGE